MNFHIIADAGGSSAEIETWKMVATFIGVLITACVTAWNIVLSGRLRRKEQHYGAQIDKALQDHKAALDTQAKEYEVKLQHFSFRNQTKFAQVHLTRVKIIAELYKYIHDTRHKLEAFTVGEDAQYAITTFDAFKETYNVMVQYFDAHRLYFPKSLESILNRAFTKFSLTATGFKMAGTFYQDAVKSDKWHDKAQSLAGELQTAITSIEEQFRKMLGSDDDEGAKQEE